MGPRPVRWAGNPRPGVRWPTSRSSPIRGTSFASRPELTRAPVPCMLLHAPPSRAGSSGPPPRSHRRPHRAPPHSPHRSCVPPGSGGFPCSPAQGLARGPPARYTPWPVTLPPWPSAPRSRRCPSRGQTRRGPRPAGLPRGTPARVVRVASSSRANPGLPGTGSPACPPRPACGFPRVGPRTGLPRVPPPQHAGRPPVPRRGLTAMFPPSMTPTGGLPRGHLPAEHTCAYPVPVSSVATRARGGDRAPSGTGIPPALPSRPPS